MNPMKRLMKMTLLRTGMLYSLRDEQDNYVTVFRTEYSKMVVAPELIPWIALKQGRIHMKNLSLGYDY